MTDEFQIQLDHFFKGEIIEHLQSLENEIERYFPELSHQQEALVKNLFCPELDVSSIPDDIQAEFMDLWTTLQLVISSRLNP